MSRIIKIRWSKWIMKNQTYSLPAYNYNTSDVYLQNIEKKGKKCFEPDVEDLRWTPNGVYFYLYNL